MDSREIMILLVLVLLFTAVSMPLRNTVIDDTYIHLQYARNLAERGELAFNSGHPSYGATSPLWVGILALFAEAGLDLLSLCHILSWLFAVLSIFLFYYYVRITAGSRWPALSAASILSVEAWLVRWSAVGMETSLAVFMVLAVMVLSTRAMSSILNSIILGVVLTLSALTRPETLILVPICGLIFIFFRPGIKWPVRLSWLAVFLVTYGAWALMAKDHTGTYFPLTAGAKQGWMVFSPSALRRSLVPLKIIGATLFLPAALFIIYLVVGLKRGDSSIKSDLAGGKLTLPLLWAVGLPLVYLILDFNILSRYLTPLAPAIITLGVVSAGRIISIAGSGKKTWRIAISVFTLIVIVQNLIFYSLVVIPPTRNFSRGVKNVLVPMGEWLGRRARPEAVVAAPDIGAVGYYSRREILDLGGLITPQINRMRNTMELEKIIEEGHFLKFDPDYYLDRDSKARRFAGKIIEGVSFVPVMSDTVSDLGIRKPGKVVYTLYRLERAGIQKSPPRNNNR